MLSPETLAPDPRTFPPDPNTHAKICTGQRLPTRGKGAPLLEVSKVTPLVFKSFQTSYLLKMHFSGFFGRQESINKFSGGIGFQRGERGRLLETAKVNPLSL